MLPIDSAITIPVLIPSNLYARAVVATLRRSTIAALDMIDLNDHPILILIVTILSYPVYQGLALAVFGSRDGFRVALRHCLTLDTWTFFKNPFLEDWNIGIRTFAFIALCVSFVAAVCRLLVRYVG